MLIAAARARRKSLCGKSSSFLIVCVRVNGSHRATVESKCLVQYLGDRARQLVVHEAFEITLCFAGS